MEKFAVLLLVVFVLGCISQNPVDKCIELCKKQTNLERGPCLSNNIEHGWVCDVAHNPREEIDNFPENQCEAFRNGTAKHFVELDTECNLIRAI